MGLIRSCAEVRRTAWAAVLKGPCRRRMSGWAAWKVRVGVGHNRFGCVEAVVYGVRVVGAEGRCVPTGWW